MNFFAPYYRWSDHDRRLGPFIYARDRRWRPFAIVLDSGDGDERSGCRFRVSALGHTLITALPPIVRPWRRKIFPDWDAATVERLGRNWYWDSYPREYGFSYADGFLQVFLGRQTHDSSTTQVWCKHLPWTQWRHVRHSYYDLAGRHYFTEPLLLRWGTPEHEAARQIEDACPTRTFAFKDFDGEQLTARTRIEEREWRFGSGWFAWLSHFRAPKIARSLDIRFSGETGKRKGSWKGGTIGHAIDMLPGELHEAAFRRYCAAHDMTFEGPAPVTNPEAAP